MPSELPRLVELFVGLNLVVTGVSHMARPAAWDHFFGMLRAKGEAGALANGLMSLGFGTLVVAFHNVWSGWSLMVTALGWLYVLKSVIVLWWPSAGRRSMAMAEGEKVTRYRWVGGTMVLLGGVCLALAAGLL